MPGYLIPTISTYSNEKACIVLKAKLRQLHWYLVTCRCFAARPKAEEVKKPFWWEAKHPIVWTWPGQLRTFTDLSVWMLTRSWFTGSETLFLATPKGSGLMLLSQENYPEALAVHKGVFVHLYSYFLPLHSLNVILNWLNMQMTQP